MTNKEELKKVKAKMYRLLNECRNNEKVVRRYRQLLCEINNWEFVECVTFKEEEVTENN